MTNVFSMPARTRSAATAVADVAARARAISLAEVLDRAGLQVRLDRKYLLSAGAFARLAVRLDGALDVLEINGRRRFNYESHYFDTPDLLTFSDHLAGRRDRYKLRTRSYLDSAETMFEVKLEGPDGGTVKRRAAHPFGDRDRITAVAHGQLAAALEAAGRSVPRELVEACVIAYRRTTFVTCDGSARITCDHDLVFANGDAVFCALDGHVLVEVKSAEPTSLVDGALAALGIATVSISKYCVGLALLHPELPSGPWDALLERYFDRTPGLAAA